eukprot:CAMPEP_0119109210 /NCGR_PEP_ID=MMETSP1180-20130426/17735_1 /TAXON_ID=3052 ORGANISM="Chlamydomonas cf sp, Strain CCMP681" /NCGR_SAMPLE_ID=MMETSP1180 /ASSEMBLY_ACC=CAM_ASM_000741 /LENGTH=296 /DNA_ID=CAMNT_0007094937 /DNA_START=15 /DNA_END=905 /DNA_ORIENTATION=+
MLRHRAAGLRKSSVLSRDSHIHLVAPARALGSSEPIDSDRHSSPRDKQEARTNALRRTSQTRRKGRPAHLRSPDDSPMRDGNRDRLIGLLTERATRTLLAYLVETNPAVHMWLFMYYRDHSIPIVGSWDEVSGETFLRTLLSMESYESAISLGGDPGGMERMAVQQIAPRSLAQRIMDIRVGLSKEFMQDLAGVEEENRSLLRETLSMSLALTEQEPVVSRALPPRDMSKVFVHPELLDKEGMLLDEVATSHPELLPVMRARKEARAADASASDSNSDSEGGSAEEDQKGGKGPRL